MKHADFFQTSHCKVRFQPTAPGITSCPRLMAFLLGILLPGFGPPGAAGADIGAPAKGVAPQRFEFREGDRILFMGDTFFEREADYGQIEARLTALFADRSLTFRNLSWSADTPQGQSRASFDWDKPETEWLKRVKEQVALVKPTVAFLSYGMTASFGGEAGLPGFKAGLAKLMDAIDEVSGQNVRFALLGPIGFEKLPNIDPSVVATNNSRLKLYSEAIQDVANQRGA